MRLMDDIDFEKYKQTRKLYATIKEYYKGKITPDTPFSVVTLHINKCVKRYSRKPRYKILYLTMRYLDEIGYPKS
jgi:hypothetical protein